MADTIKSPAEPAAAAAPAKAATGKHKAHHHHAHHSFHHALSHAGGRTATRPSGAGAVSGTLPEAVDGAIRTAMAREGAPDSWTDALRFLVQKESGGLVDVRNPRHSARGLFQLTAANYTLNPRGAASFGNAVEEAQGGIRYIRARYGTADAAADFWRKKGWF